MLISFALSNVFDCNINGEHYKIRKDFKFSDNDTGLIVCGRTNIPEVYEKILKDAGFKIIFKSDRCYNYYHDRTTPRQTLIVFEK